MFIRFLIFFGICKNDDIDKLLKNDIKNIDDTFKF